MDGSAVAGVIAPARGLRRLTLASPSDAGDIAEFLAAPLPGAIRISMMPFARACAPGATASLRRHAVVARADDGRVLAHGARCVRTLKLNGEWRWVGYLSGLRRDDSLAGDGRRLAEGLRLLQATRVHDEAEHDFTSILSDNKRARRVLEQGVPGAPRYHPLGSYRTAIMSAKIIARFAPPSEYYIGACAIDDVDELQSLLDLHSLDYSPQASVRGAIDDWFILRRGSLLCGGVRIWDRRMDQRLTVAGYSRGIAVTRPLLNIALRCMRRPTLPHRGIPLSLIYAAHLVSTDASPGAIHALLAAVARAALARGCDRIALGFAAEHPLASTLSQLPAWPIDSILYAVGQQPRSVNCPNPEAALL
jgi:hypothetical protein